MDRLGIGSGKVVVPNNPYMAQVNIEILPNKVSNVIGRDSGSNKKWESIKLSSADNNYILSFSSTSAGTQGSEAHDSDINISILDRTGALIDSILSNLYSDTIVRYSYGYVGGQMSDSMEAIVKGYGSTLTPHGERIDLNLVTKPNSGEGTTMYTKTYQGNISDIVRKIAQEEGWEIGNIEETVKLFQQTTSTVKPEEYSQEKETYLAGYGGRVQDPMKWLQETSGGSSNGSIKS